MKMISAHLVLVLTLCCLSNLSSILGQVQKEGHFKPYGFVKSGSFNDVIVEGPRLDNEILMKAALEQDRPDPLTHMRPQAPHKFAEAVDVQIDITDPTRGTWIEDVSNNRRTWRSIVKSPGALSVSLLFSDFMLPEGGELYIIGKDETLGAFTAEVNNKATRKFATTPISGESVIIEYHESLNNKNSGKPPALRVGKIVHGFRATPFAYGASGHCQVDVECRKNAKNEDAINSTVVIITDDGTSFCTGTMLNNARQDGTQLVLTANHCIFSDPSFFIIGFNYQQPTCYKSRQEASTIPPKPQTAHGVTLVTKWETSDFALLKIAEKIPGEYNAYMAGWDATLRAPVDVYGVHHPYGDVKKISTFQGQTILSTWTPYDRIKMHWKIPRWSEGSTERGSSGSALFNSLGHVVGHLRGGASSCSTPDGWDMYGGLFADFHYPPENIRLSKYLDPDNTGIRVINGISIKDLNNQSPPPPHPQHPQHQSPQQQPTQQHQAHHPQHVNFNMNRPPHFNPNQVLHQRMNSEQIIQTEGQDQPQSQTSDPNGNTNDQQQQIPTYITPFSGNRRHRETRRRRYPTANPQNGFQMLHHNYHN